MVSAREASPLDFNERSQSARDGAGETCHTGSPRGKSEHFPKTQLFFSAQEAQSPSVRRRNLLQCGGAISFSAEIGEHFHKRQHFKNVYHASCKNPGCISHVARSEICVRKFAFLENAQFLPRGEPT